MFKNARRPVTYGKTTRRYLLSESQDDQSHRRLWREPSSRRRASPSESPDLGLQQSLSTAQKFDVPSSESDAPAPRLVRPLKKRKLTPPAADSSESLDQACGSGNGAAGGSAAIIDEFDVPLSEDELPQPRKKTAQIMTKSLPKSSSQSYAKNQEHSRKRSPSLQLKLEASPRPKTREPHLKPTPTDASGASGSKVLPGLPETIDVPHSASKHAAGDKSRQRSVGLSSKAKPSRKLGYAGKQPSARPPIQAEPRPLPEQRRPHTPPNHEESDDPISSTQDRAHVSVKLTPGGLDLIGLTFDDGTSQKVSAASKEAEMNRHQIKEPDTPRRRKLKDRLANLGPNEDTDTSISYLPAGSLDYGEPQAEHSQGHIRAGGVLDVEPQMDDQLISRNGLGDALAGRRKVTYGRQRSHLSESQLDENAIWSVPLEDASVRPAGRRLLSPVLRDNSASQEQSLELSDDEEVSNEQTLRSVHELRAAGEARRTGFLLDTMFDDIQAATSTGSARGAAFRLADKLLEPGFSDEFVRHGSLSNLFNLRAFKQDQFVSSAFAVAMLQVVPLVPIAELRGQGHVSTIIGNFETLLPWSTPLMNVCKAKKANMSRIHQADLNRLCRLCCARSSWESIGSQHLTPRLIGLQGLEICIRRLRKAGAMYRLVTMETFSKISSMLKLLVDRDGDNRTTSDIGELEGRLAISAMESLSVGEFLGHGKAGTKSSETVVEDIATSLPYILRSAPTMQNGLISLALRLCLNVTTKYASSCNAFAKRDAIAAVTKLIKESFERAEQADPAKERDDIVDNLVLGLGFLTNLTEEIPECRAKFNQPSANDESELSTLLAIFQARHENAASAVTESETKINVAFGYLAVLLCSLCLDANIRAHVASVLADSSLMMLRQAMAQFVVFHRSIDMGLDPSEEDTELNPQAAFVERLQQVLSALNTVCKA